ncbi:CinA family protein [Nocardioides rotundus]|uniref:CinA family protein n=1 Tax=Nocardioides rotundus TaxID=1774216 RepID=UPI001CBD0573|nr:CinA family protein [Nocardioides rotundus]UAL31212.1 CinA family protein [Nocardioides rotundus]
MEESEGVAQALVRELTDRGETLAAAESITGGRVAAAVTAVPGSSAVLAGAVVSYATRVKVDVLGVPAEVVERDGVVSEACARAMAEGVRRLLDTTWSVATTGVAGPGPSEGVPAGTVWVGLAGPGTSRAVLLGLEGSRGEIQATATDDSLGLLAREVIGLR